MATDPSNAREVIAMRNLIQNHLRVDELRAVNWRALADASTAALARGWTGTELARWAVADLGDGAKNPGAVMLTTIRDLGQVDPPRERTPGPPPAQDVLASIHRANEPSRDPSAWIARMRT